MKNIKYLLCVLVGILLTIGIGSAYNLNASLVTYDNKNTALESENVAGALNELGLLATTKLSEIENKIGDLSKLNTTNKDNIVNSINELSLLDNKFPDYAKATKLLLIENETQNEISSEKITVEEDCLVSLVMTNYSNYQYSYAELFINDAEISFVGDVWGGTNYSMINAFSLGNYYLKKGDSFYVKTGQTTVYYTIIPLTR